MFATLQLGFQLPTWKSLKLVHILVSGLNLPLGVDILIPLRASQR